MALVLSDDKITELFFEIGGITQKVDEVYRRLVGPEPGKGELDLLKKALADLQMAVVEERVQRGIQVTNLQEQIDTINLTRRERRRTLAKAWTIGTAVGGGLFKLAEFLYKKGK